MNEWNPGIQKVLDHVAARLDWCLIGTAIRRPVRHGAMRLACPVSSLINREACDWTYVREIDPIDAALLVNCADGDDHPAILLYSYDLRQALLKAARLA